MAEGLTAVHSHGTLHCDLKPADVLLSAGRPKPTDFGIARALDATSYTRTATVLGTTAFTSPEQVRAEGACPASDVFPLSCLLVFAVAGHGPFGEGPGHAVPYRTVHEESDLSGLPGEPADVVRQRSAVAAAACSDTGGGWWARVGGRLKAGWCGLFVVFRT